MDRLDPSNPLTNAESFPQDPFLNAFVNLKLAACGAPVLTVKAKEQNFLNLVDPILKSYQEQQHQLIEQGAALCPADQRVQNFLNSYLSDTGEAVPQIPSRQLKLDRHGLAKMLSLPRGEDLFQNEIITSYRVKQGILHNPKNDKRTTEGVFHIAEGGLPVSMDKKVVPKVAFQRILQSALNPPTELLTLPFTAKEASKAELFVSLLLRPVLSPEVDGFIKEKRQGNRGSPLWGRGVRVASRGAALWGAVHLVLVVGAGSAFWRNEARLRTALLRLQTVMATDPESQASLSFPHPEVPGAGQHDLALSLALSLQLAPS